MYALALKERWVLDRAGGRVEDVYVSPRDERERCGDAARRRLTNVGNDARRLRRDGRHDLLLPPPTSSLHAEPLSTRHFPSIHLES